MSGIDGIVFDDMENPVIKYVTIYTPNPLICKDVTFTSFIEMQEAIGNKLEAASERAYANNEPFVPYTVKTVLKPEFVKPEPESIVQQISDPE